MVKDIAARHLESGHIVAQVGEQHIMLAPKVFKTGSLGWHGQAKVLHGDSRVQVNIVATVIGSKPPAAPSGTVSGAASPEHSNMPPAKAPKRPRKRSGAKVVSNPSSDHPEALEAMPAGSDDNRESLPIFEQEQL